MLLKKGVPCVSEVGGVSDRGIGMSEVEEQWLLLEDQLPGLFWHWRRTRVRLLRNRGSSGRAEDPSRGVSVSACPLGCGTDLETNEVGRLFKGAQFLEPRLGEPQSRAPPAARFPVPVLGREAGRLSGQAPAAERCWAGPDATARAPRPPRPARAPRAPHGRSGPGAPSASRQPELCARWPAPHRPPAPPARPARAPHPPWPLAPAPVPRPRPRARRAWTWSRSSWPGATSGAGGSSSAPICARRCWRSPLVTRYRPDPAGTAGLGKRAPGAPRVPTGRGQQGGGRRARVTLWSARTRGAQILRDRGLWVLTAATAPSANFSC